MFTPQKYVNKSRKKGKYSKSGCSECKRRKIKCDETKPICWHCQRLDKTCIFLPPKLPKYKRKKIDIDTNTNVNNSSSTSNSNDNNNDNDNDDDNGDDNDDDNGDDNGDDDNNNNKNIVKNVNNIDTINKINTNIHNTPTAELLPQLQISHLVHPSNNDLPNVFELSQANSLASSLNDILNTKIEEVITTHPFSTPSPNNIFTMLESGDYIDLNSPILSIDSNSTNQPKPVIQHVSLLSFPLPNPHSNYLKLFYDQYSYVILPFCPSKDVNPARDIILHYAKSHSYLLAAVLACGALTSHRKTQLDVDEQRYCMYLSTSMSLLSHLLNDEINGNDNVKGEVEPMILTTLLLTSYNANSNVVKWRPHLVAAGELLMNYKSEDSEILAFCRVWFVSIEILAGLTATKGGTIEEDVEVDLWMRKEEGSLRSLKLCRNDGFNLICGYTAELGVAFRKLIKAIRKVKRNEKISLLEINLLFNLFLEIKDFSVVSSTGYASADNLTYPTFKGNVPMDENLPEGSIEKFEMSDGEILYVSWYDISYQAHLYVGLLTLLTIICKLPKTNYLVRETIQNILELLRFLKCERRITNYGLMMFQYCVYLTGVNCIYDYERQIISKYFNDLKELGNVAGRHSMKKLRKEWEKYDSMKKDNGDNLPENETENDDEEDIINY